MPVLHGRLHVEWERRGRNVGPANNDDDVAIGTPNRHLEFANGGGMGEGRWSKVDGAVRLGE